MIFSLCRWNDALARDIVAAIISAIRKHPEVGSELINALWIIQNVSSNLVPILLLIGLSPFLQSVEPVGRVNRDAAWDATFH